MSAAPTREDAVARWASPLLGGPAGRRRAEPGHPWWSPARVLVLLAGLTTALAVVRAQHCRAVGWTSPGQFVHTCYSDVAVLHGTLGGTPRALLGLDPATPDGLGQPALTTYLGALLAALVAPAEALARRVAPAAEGVSAGTRVYFDLYAVLACLALVAAVLAVVRLSGRRPWDATLLALSPVVVLSGLVSFDLLGVALGVVGVAAWARGHPLLAGVVLGLAVSARLHVVLVLLALVLLAVRAGAVRHVALVCSSAAFTWAAVNLPLAVLSPQAWTAPARGWWGAEPGYGSLLLLPRLAVDEQVAGVRALTATQASVVSAVLTGAVLLAVAVWVLACPRAPRLPLVVLVLLVGTLLVAKTVPVQASLWLLPWAALAVPVWRDHLWWWAAEALYVVAVWEYLVGLSTTDRALPPGFYAVLLVARLAALAWLGWRAWRTGWHPTEDPVRRDADGEDPAAGPLRAQDDRFVVELA
ncbi:hypothetical protein [Aquipuribacter hungaricus]|uniref:DUF2029 domain-containing protein n=1 Tax=Aquipuribacter hungaricus TaxID=545624 RepID=A0ABV7WHE7_9MICO